MRATVESASSTMEISLRQRISRVIGSKVRPISLASLKINPQEPELVRPHEGILADDEGRFPLFYHRGAPEGRVGKEPYRS